MPDSTPVYFGHRERMRHKLTEHGTRFFETYELLEMLLYYVIPRKNTHPIAKLLLRRFSTLEAIFAASPKELATVEGVGLNTAKFIHDVGLLINSTSDEISSKPIVTTRKQISNFLIDYFKDKTENEVVLLMLDSNMNYIDFAKIYSLDLSSGAVHPKPFIDEAVKRGTSICIVAHNHPHSIPVPTDGDWETNKMLREAFRDAGITLFDSLTVTDKCYSGFMSIIETRFAQDPVFHEFFEEEAEER